MLFGFYSDYFKKMSLSILIELYFVYKPYNWPFFTDQRNLEDSLLRLQNQKLGGLQKKTILCNLKFKNNLKQAGAELGQAKVKLDDIVVIVGCS